MSSFLEVGWGESYLADAQHAGAEATRKALERLGHAVPELVLVFASDEYDLEMVEKGVNAVVSGYPTITKSLPNSGESFLRRSGVLVNMVTSAFASLFLPRNQSLAEDEVNEFLQERHKAFQELSAVHKLGNMLNSSLDLDNVINKAVDIVGKLMLADGCALLLTKETEKGLTLTLSAFYGSEEHECIKNEDFKGSFAYHAMVLQKPLITGDAAKSPYTSKQINRITRAKSIMAVPVTGKGTKVGVLCVYSSERDFFTKDDLRFLGILANQIGIAVLNADLFRRTQIMAYTDGLTELYQHNFFLKYLDNLIDNAAAEVISLILIDLDGFKYINEQFGNKTGDDILIQTASILRTFFGSGNLVARYGGDEFVVVLPQVTSDQSLLLAEEVRRKIAEYKFSCSASEFVHRLTVSIGTATFPQDGSRAMELIDKANRAMYRVKRSAGDRVEAYVADLKDVHLTEFDQAFFDIIRILIDSLDSRDRYTWEHSRQVSKYAAAIAQEMGLTRQEVETIRLASYLHDLGKIHLDFRILNKPKWLDEEEFRAVKLHPVVGANLISPIQGFAPLVPLVLYHHEWFNGQGYPKKLCSQEIPLGARIIAVADGFDAMTSNRPYRRSLPDEDAMAELIRMKGTQYDPDVVEAMRKVLKRTNTWRKNIG